MIRFTSTFQKIVIHYKNGNWRKCIDYCDELLFGNCDDFSRYNLMCIKTRAAFNMRNKSLFNEFLDNLKKAIAILSIPRSSPALFDGTKINSDHNLMTHYLDTFFHITAYTKFRFNSQFEQDLDSYLEQLRILNHILATHDLSLVDQFNITVLPNLPLQVIIQNSKY